METLSQSLHKLTQYDVVGDAVSVGEILDIFANRSFALAILLCATFNVVLAILPGISFMMGVPIMVFAAQMALGMPKLWCPASWKEKSIPRARLDQGLQKTIYFAEKLERFMRPRLAFMGTPWALRTTAIVIFILGAIISLPLPFFNLPPSLALYALALGILSRDGLVILLGYGFAFLNMGVLFSVSQHIAALFA